MRHLLVLLALSAAAGCGDDGPAAMDSGTTDDSSIVDSAALDSAVTDTASPDSVVPDSTASDSAVTDTATWDSAVSPECMASAESLCADRLTPSDVICDGTDAVMARCETFETDEWWTPCDAPVGCGATAHVCGAAEYLASVRGPVGQPAWIDACLRDGGDLFAAPREGRCSSCEDDVATEATAAWLCDGSGATTSSTNRIGMRADRQCWEVGEDRVRGLWVPYGVTSMLKSVMCCD